MALPDRDVERLDHALDTHLQGRKENKSGVLPDLVEAFTRIRVMNEQVNVDSTLKQELWRSMMSTVPIPAATQLNSPNRLSGSRKFHIPFVGGSQRRGRAGRVIEPAFTILVIVTFCLGFLAYKQTTTTHDSRELPASIAALLPVDAPNIADCTIPAREPGTVASLAGQPQSTRPAFPRYNDDPVFQSVDSPNLSSKNVNGKLLLSNSGEMPAVDPNVDSLLRDLFNCSPYMFDGSFIAVGLDGKYFALFTDDYFRREFAGYREAGVELRLVRWFFVDSIPVVLDVRTYGDRLLLILQKRNPRDTANPVLMLAKVGDQWRIDEVGNAEMPDSWTQKVASLESTPIASPTAASLRYNGPLISNYTLYGVAGTATPIPEFASASTICDEIPGGETLKCGWYYSRLGPYWYNEFPANTDFTVVFHNTSSEVRRVVVPALGIQVQVESGESIPIILNADPGSYLFQIFERSENEPLDGGVFYFVDPNGRFSMG